MRLSIPAPLRTCHWAALSLLQIFWSLWLVQWLSVHSSYTPNVWSFCAWAYFGLFVASENRLHDRRGNSFSSTIRTLAWGCVNRHFFMAECTCCLMNQAISPFKNGMLNICFTIASMNVSRLDYRTKHCDVTSSAPPWLKKMKQNCLWEPGGCQL